MKARNRGVRRERLGNVDLVVTPGTGHDMIQARAGFVSDRDPRTFLAEVAARVAETGARPVSQMVFGTSELHGICTEALASEFDGIRWPVTWIESGSGMTATQMSAVRGPRVEAVEMDGRVVATHRLQRVVNEVPPSVLLD